MESSTKSATAGLRPLIMGKASAHEAQYAAAHLDAHRKPNPPMRMGKLATCCALARSAQLWRSKRFSTTPQMPSSCAAAYSSDWLGGNVRRVWFALGLALWSKSCQAHCKSGTAGIVSHSLRSSAILRDIFCLTNSMEPICVSPGQDSDPVLLPHIRHCVRPVPHSGLPWVQLDVCSPNEGIREETTAQKKDAIWLADQTNIVQQCAQLFTWKGDSCHLLQRSLYPQRKQEWHQRVSLFPSFCLGDCATLPIVGEPLVA